MSQPGRLWKRTIKVANGALRFAGLRLEALTDRRHWDAQFARWIAKARDAGVDPNDVGDQEWSGNALEGCRQYLFPLMTPDAVVLELGPGSGRYTRHVLPRCARMILVDYSKLVCDWLSEYLHGKGTFTVHHIQQPLIPEVADESVDVVFANGVFEHIDPDDTDYFLQEFRRVLKPGGRLWFNFDNFMSPGGSEWFRDQAPRPGARRVFRFYHPDMLKRMAEMRGFHDVQIGVSEGRLATLLAQR